MTGYGRWIRRRRVELAAVFIIIGVFAALIATRVPRYEAAMEQASLEASISVMRAGLAQTVMVDRIHGDKKAEAALAGSNPLKLTAQPPGGYLGVRPGLNPAKAPPGSWYFDPTRGLLIYRVRSTWAFSSPLGTPARVELRIVDPNQRSPRLVSVAPYHFSI